MIFLRRKLTYASTEFSEASASAPHTRVSRSCLDTMRPVPLMSMRMTSNSRFERCAEASPQDRSCVSRLRLRSPNSMVSMTISPFLRVRARTRARSSGASKGLVM